MTRWLPGKSREWFARCPLGWILLVALILRLIAIDSRGLQYDDVFSIFLADRSLPEIVSGTAADTMPPLYYFLLHFWMRISREVWFIRLLTVLLSVGVTALVYGTVERWLGRAAAVWAALLTSVSPLQIYHAQDVRMYALLVLGQAAYLWFFTRIWFGERDGKTRGWDWGGLVLSGLVAMYSHNLAVFGLVAPNLFLLVRRRWRLLIRLVAAQLLIGLGALPWLILLPGQMEKIQRAFWTPRPGPVEIIQAVILFTASLPLPPVLLVIVAVLSFQVLLFVALEVWRGRKEDGIGFLVLALIVPPALLFITSYIMRPVFVTRGFLVSSLAYYGLAGYVIARAWPRGTGKIVAGAFALAVILSLPSHYTFNQFPRSPFREAAAYLMSSAPEAALVHETKLSYFPTDFYAPDLPQVFLADVPGSTNDTFAPASQQAMHIFPQPDLPAAVGDRSEVYFITFRKVFEEYAAAGKGQHPGIAWLEERFQPAERIVFQDLEIYHYVR